MKERLVELMSNFNYKCLMSCKDGLTSKDCNGCVQKQLADYLLANGVIVPPVTIGDRVYRISGNLRGEKIYKGAVDQIVVRDDNRVVFYIYGHPLHFTEYDIGKTVFLSREEAEAKLKETSHDKADRHIRW